MDDEKVHHNGPVNDHETYAEESKIVQIAQVVTGPPNPPPLEPSQSIVSEAGTVNERPVAFGPLWKEILIVLLCTCGPMVQVVPHEMVVDRRHCLRRRCWWD